VTRQGKNGKVRYAVVGLGWISQVAILPAFANAEDSELVALVSSDPVKLQKLGDHYHAPHRYTYEQYDQCLQNPEVDVVFNALPNSMHPEYTIRAARAGVHTLCEKPMALTEADGRAMIEACEANNVKLMVAYRLHFETANLRAVEAIRSGTIGEPRLFSSVFTGNIDSGNHRLSAEMGGGAIWDLGVYCVNAARYLFGEEPVEVLAANASGSDPRFQETPELTSLIMRFPGGKLATFITGFGMVGSDNYEVVGTKGRVRLGPGYPFASDLTIEIMSGGVKETAHIPRADHFGPEIVHFSECVLTGQEPGPNGYEGLADVQIICAALKSAETGQPVKLEGLRGGRRPTLDQVMVRPPVTPPPLVNTKPPGS
jgi:predicted dehydrogenase